jgi:hypothetical protein
MAKELTVDERRCLEQLEEWEEVINNLTAFVGAATEVARDKHDRHSGEWVTEARAQLQTLKRELRAEAERLTTLEEGGKLNTAELNYYAPAVRQASAYFTLSVDSTDGEEWRQQLAEALITIRYPLFQLKSRDGSAGK